MIDFLKSLGGSLFNLGLNTLSTNSMMRNQFDYGKKMFDYTSEYNSPKNQVSRLKDAGINPALALSTITGNNGSVSMPSGSGAPQKTNNDFIDAMAMKQMCEQTRSMRLDNDNKAIDLQIKEEVLKKYGPSQDSFVISTDENGNIIYQEDGKTPVKEFVHTPNDNLGLGIKSYASTKYDLEKKEYNLRIDDIRLQLDSNGVRELINEFEKEKYRLDKESLLKLEKIGIFDLFESIRHKHLNNNHLEKVIDQLEKSIEIEDLQNWIFREDWGFPNKLKGLEKFLKTLLFTLKNKFL